MLKEKSEIFNIRYVKYISDITAKRLNVLMPLSVLILTLLIFSDIYIRHSYAAVLTRIFPLFLSIYLYIYNKVNPKPKVGKTVVYNILLASIPAMMFAKYLVHYGTDTSYTNIIGIIVAVFIISLEVRADLLNTILIYAVPPFIFAVVLFMFFPVNQKEAQSLINIVLALLIGFFVNRVQNNFRYKAFVSNYLLQSEKLKLEESNDKLNHYKRKLEDMVEKKTLSLRYALEKAKESDALKTQFLQNISHELRTPMNAVIGFSDIVSKKKSSFKKEYKIIEQSLNRLLKTIDNIILLSKLQSGKTGLELSKFYAAKLNKDLLDIIKFQIEESGKPLTVEFKDNTGGDFYFYSDEEKIKQIFNQIFDNAVKYTEKGKIEILINKKNDNEVEYIVSDSGIGIPSEELPFIFDVFRKSDKRNKFYEGTGIGLSIAKFITKLLGGRIFVKSSENNGTTVKLILKISNIK